MKPLSPMIRNDQALKKSSISDHSSTNHMNPLSKKPSLTKRNSLNVSQDHSTS